MDRQERPGSLRFMNQRVGGGIRLLTRPWICPAVGLLLLQHHYLASLTGKYEQNTRGRGKFHILI